MKDFPKTVTYLTPKKGMNRQTTKKTAMKLKEI